MIPWHPQIDFCCLLRNYATPLHFPPLFQFCRSGLGIKMLNVKREQNMKLQLSPKLLAVSSSPAAKWSNITKYLHKQVMHKKYAVFLSVDFIDWPLKTSSVKVHILLLLLWRMALDCRPKLLDIIWIIMYTNSSPAWKANIRQRKREVMLLVYFTTGLDLQHFNQPPGEVKATAVASWSAPI